MNERTRTLIYIGVFIIVISVIGMFLQHIGKQPQNENKISEVGSTKILEIEEKDFEKEVLQSDQKVLVDFYATWCGPCRVLKPTIVEFANENENIKVVEIDVDKAENLSNRYGVVSIPTLIVIENGQEINREIGVISKEKILEICELK